MSLAERSYMRDRREASSDTSIAQAELAERQRCLAIVDVAADAARLGVELDVAAAIRSGMTDGEFSRLALVDVAFERTPPTCAGTFPELLAALGVTTK